eukprot:g2666.t1
MLETSGNDSTLVDCTAFVAQISEASEVRRAIKEVTQTTKVVPALTIVQAQRLPKKSVLLRCTADVSESEESTEGLVLTQSFAFTSAQLAWNSTGLDALESLGRLLQRAQLTLKEAKKRAKRAKRRQSRFFNQELMRTGSPRENPPPPARGEYEAPSECAECQVAAKCVAARKAPTDLEMLAKQRGYHGMRINMVVSTNVAAQRVCSACGFRVLCVLPRAFHHPERGLVDTCLMFHGLGEEEPTTRPLPVMRLPEAPVRPSREERKDHILLTGAEAGGGSLPWLQGR